MHHAETGLASRNVTAGIEITAFGFIL